jgi:hypothetical protein
MDKQTAIRIIGQIKKSIASIDDEIDLPGAIQFLCDDYFDNDIDIEMQGIKGAPNWLSFEMRIWELGECLRQSLKNRKKWLNSNDLLNVIMMICRNKKYGKGRQTFVMLLGEFNCEDASKLLGDLLNDPEVLGHSIKALTKLKDGGYVDKAGQIAEKETGWIRAAAKNYCRRFGV